MQPAAPPTQGPLATAAGTRPPSGWPHVVITEHDAPRPSERVKSTHSTKTGERRSKPSNNAVRRWRASLCTRRCWRRLASFVVLGPEDRSQRDAPLPSPFEKVRQAVPQSRLQRQVCVPNSRRSIHRAENRCWQGKMCRRQNSPWPRTPHHADPAHRKA